MFYSSLITDEHCTWTWSYCPWASPALPQTHCRPCRYGECRRILRISSWASSPAWRWHVSRNQNSRKGRRSDTGAMPSRTVSASTALSLPRSRNTWNVIHKAACFAVFLSWFGRSPDSRIPTLIPISSTMQKKVCCKQTFFASFLPVFCQSFFWQSHLYPITSHHIEITSIAFKSSKIKASRNILWFIILCHNVYFR